MIKQGILFLIMSALLGGCATIVPQTKFTFPSPPSELMIPAQQMQPIVVGKNGDVNPKTALEVIVHNNTIAKRNTVKLEALQNWIKQSSKNIKKVNKN